MKLLNQQRTISLFAVVICLALVFIISRSVQFGSRSASLSSQQQERAGQWRTVLNFFFEEVRKPDHYDSGDEENLTKSLGEGYEIDFARVRQLRDIARDYKQARIIMIDSIDHNGTIFPDLQLRLDNERVAWVELSQDGHKIIGVDMP